MNKNESPFQLMRQENAMKYESPPIDHEANRKIQRYCWLNPFTDPPPSGQPILLKTWLNVPIIGKWVDTGVYVSWQYLPMDP